MMIWHKLLSRYDYTAEIDRRSQFDLANKKGEQEQYIIKHIWEKDVVIARINLFTYLLFSLMENNE